MTQFYYHQSKLDFLNTISALASHIKDSSSLCEITINKPQNNINLISSIENEASFMLGVLTSRQEFDANNEIKDIEYLLTESLAQGDTPLKTSAVDATAKISRYWIRNYHDKTHFDKNRLTLSEKRRLASFIRNNLLCNDIKVKFATLALAISYTTYLTIREATAFLCNDKFVPITQNLDLRIPIIPPDKAYEPPEDKASELLDQVKFIDLPLHPVIQGTLSTLIKISNTGSQIQPCLSQSDISTVISDFISTLRNHGQYDISQKRIDMALNLEITLNDQNPISTYLLTGRDTQAPPTLLYYTAPDISKFVHIYHSTILGLLSE